jgi:hypothetical protein
MTLVVVGALLASCASADKGEEVSAKPAKEVAAAGARIRGGGIRMDVQIGRTLAKTPAKAGSVKVAPNAVVTP